MFIVDFVQVFSDPSASAAPSAPPDEEEIDFMDFFGEDQHRRDSDLASFESLLQDARISSSSEMSSSNSR